MAIQVLAKQRGWSEVKRMEMERVWVGEPDNQAAMVSFGWKVECLPQEGFETRRFMVSGWMVPVFESRRAARCKHCPISQRCNHSDWMS